MARPLHIALEKLPPYIELDDAMQVVELARIEALASGFDPEAAAMEALGDFISAERTRQARETPASARFSGLDPDHGASLGWIDQASKVSALSPARSQTPGQRRRFLRNQIIFAATLAGFSRRKLALAFGLPHSRICAIVEEMRRKTHLN